MGLGPCFRPDTGPPPGLGLCTLEPAVWTMIGNVRQALGPTLVREVATLMRNISRYINVVLLVDRRIRLWFTGVGV